MTFDQLSPTPQDQEFKASAEQFASAAIRELQEFKAANRATERRVVEVTQEQIQEGEPLTAMDVLENGTNNLEWEIHRSEEAREYVRTKLRGKVIDVGCGSLNELHDIVPDEDVTYVDIEDYRANHVNFIQADIGKDIPVPDNSYDSGFAQAFIQDSEEVTRGHLQELVRVIKPNGIIVFHPHEEFLLDTLVGLQSLGIELREKCDLQIFTHSKDHKNLGLHIDLPQVFIAVQIEKHG